MNFLVGLQENNNREWFQANKAWYDEARGEYENFVNALIPGIAGFDETLRFVEAKDCMFRIYRDVRFSKNKEPYKTNFGAWMTQGGRKSSGSGYYFHMEPGQVFLSGGIYMPDPELLKRIRQEIYYNYEEFDGILKSKGFRKYFEGIDEWNKAKLPPRDFPPTFHGLDVLKNKSYTVSYSLEPKALQSKDLLKTCIAVFRAVNPFNEFLRKATVP